MLNLRELRKQYKMTAEQLAKKLGVSKQAVCAWERGDKEIPEDRKKEIAVIFGIDKGINDRELENSNLTIEIPAADREEEFLDRMLEYIVRMPGGESLDVLFRNRREAQKKLEEEIHNSFDGPNNIPISKQIKYIDRGLLIYSNLLKIMNAIYEKPINQQAAYFKVMIESIYGLERAMGIGSNQEIDERAGKNKLNPERQNAATETYKRLLEDSLQEAETLKKGLTHDFTSFVVESAKGKDATKAAEKLNKTMMEREATEKEHKNKKGE